MNSDTLDCCCGAGKMREGRHDFMARVGDEIVVVKDVPALICDTCGEVEYTLETSRDRCDHKGFLCWEAAGQAPGGGGGCQGQEPARRSRGGWRCILSETSGLAHFNSF